MFNMPFFVFIVAILPIVNSAPVSDIYLQQTNLLIHFFQMYNNIFDLLRDEDYFTISTITTTSTTKITPPHQHQSYFFDKTSLKIYVNEFLGFIFLSLVSMIGYYLRKFYENNGHCKVRIKHYYKMYLINMLLFSVVLVHSENTC